MLCWIDARDRTRYQNFSPQPPCLLKGTTRKLVAGYAARKAEVILDSRRRSGLSAGRLSLDHNGAKPFGCPVDRRGKASRPTTDNRNIEFGGTRRSLEPKSACKIPHFGIFDYGTVSQSRHGTIDSRPGDASKKAIASGASGVTQSNEI